MPYDEVIQPHDNLSQVIAPILREETPFLTLEDELPNPTAIKENKGATVVDAFADRHQLALIIDDMGYDLKAMRRILELPFAVTVAILPDTPHAAEIARLAHQHGLKVMLHMPMQTSNPKYQQKMEKFYLHTDLSKKAFTEIFEKALAKVPYVEGVNNHMGSRLTEDSQSMVWLMELCKKHGLFFIDSRTSSKSVGTQAAKDAGIAWNARDIFLDHSLSPDALQHAWDSAVSCVKRNDHCVMLGHPHKETISFLEQHAQGLNAQDFVPITQLLKEG